MINPKSFKHGVARIKNTELHRVKFKDKPVKPHRNIFYPHGEMTSARNRSESPPWGI
jgi:hypothetical protein